jgi:hypothetical protein
LGLPTLLLPSGLERMCSSYPFLISALDGNQWSASLYPRAKTPGTHWIGGLCLRAGLETDSRRKVICLCSVSTPDLTVCIQTLPSILSIQIGFLDQGRTVFIKQVIPLVWPIFILLCEYVSHCLLL